MAGRPGFEPELPDSETGVLPLNYPPTSINIFISWICPYVNLKNISFYQLYVMFFIKNVFKLKKN
jgi:hypothetical protein